MKKSFRKFLESPEVVKEYTPAQKMEALVGIQDELTRKSIVTSYALARLQGDNVTAYNTRMQYEKLPKHISTQYIVADVKSFFESFDTEGDEMLTEKIANVTTGIAGLARGTDEGEATVGVAAKPIFTKSAVDRNTVVGRQYIRWQGEADVESPVRISQDRMIKVNKIKAENKVETVGKGNADAFEQVLNLYNEQVSTMIPLAVKTLDQGTDEISEKEQQVSKGASVALIQMVEGQRRIVEVIESMLVGEEVKVPTAWNTPEAKKLLDAADFGNNSKATFVSLDARPVQIPVAVGEGIIDTELSTAGIRANTGPIRDESPTPPYRRHGHDPVDHDGRPFPADPPAPAPAPKPDTTYPAFIPIEVPISIDPNVPPVVFPFPNVVTPTLKPGKPWWKPGSWDIFNDWWWDGPNNPSFFQPIFGNP